MFFFLKFLKGVLKPKPYVTPTPTQGQITTTHPWNIGFASDIFNVKLCVSETKNLSCPVNYLMVIMSEHLVNSKTPCLFEYVLYIKFDSRHIFNEFFP